MLDIRRMTSLTLALLLILPAAANAEEDAGYAQRQQAVKQNMELARRLENVSAPLLMSKAPQCGNKLKTYIGAHFVTKDAVGDGYQEIMENLYGAANQPTVTIIGKNTPAFDSLETGDIVTAVDGKALKTGRDSLEEIDAALAKNTGAKPMTFTISRNGVAKDVQVSPVHACDVSVRLDPSNEDKITADGNKIMVAKGLMYSVKSDAELAREIEKKLGAVTGTQGG